MIEQFLKSLTWYHTEKSLSQNMPYPNKLKVTHKMSRENYYNFGVTGRQFANRSTVWVTIRNKEIEFLIHHSNPKAAITNFSITPDKELSFSTMHRGVAACDGDNGRGQEIDRWSATERRGSLLSNGLESQDSFLSKDLEADFQDARKSLSKCSEASS